jgi:FkbM family methyltransferase
MGLPNGLRRYPGQVMSVISSRAATGYQRAAGRVRFQKGFEAMHRLALHGMNMGGAADDPTSSGEAAVIESLHSEPVVFDVGANVGAYAEIVLRLRPHARIFCFEPSPVAYRELVGRLAGRGAAYNHGLGSREESVTLYAPEPGSMLASPHRRRHPNARWEPVETVRLRPLDIVLGDLGISHIDLLKLDVEGHELAVLRGASQLLDAGQVGAIQFEFGGCAVDSRVYLRDFFELLGDRYAIHRVVRDGVHPVEYSELHEVFTTTNYLAVARTLPGDS